MRLIDADEALRLFDNDVETMKTKIEGKVPFQVGAAMVSAAKEIRTSLKETLDQTPTLDYAPVRHGEWGAAEIVGYDGIHAVYAVPCSACKEYTELYRARYCPNCGARMEEDGTDENA